MALVSPFGYSIALAVVGTSLAMIILGEKWQRIEQSAYAADKRPIWFIVLSIMVILWYCVTLYSFVMGPKTIAGWMMVVIIPLGWAAKASLVTFNSKGRQVVSAISGRDSWVKVGLARLPVAIIFAVLAFLA